MYTPTATIESPEIAPRPSAIRSGTTKRNKNKVARPNAKTLIVWVKVTMAPKKAACFKLARDPTKYAATIVLPCPGVKA